MNCHDMKTGNNYECKTCGLKIQVVSECNCESCDSCAADELTCCGNQLTSGS